MKRAWQTDLAQGSDKLVLLALADFANDASGEAWPSNETLAAKCSRSEQAVRDALRRLVAAGHLTRIDRSGRTALLLVHPIAATPPEIQGGFEFHKGSENDSPTPPENQGGTPPEIHRGPLPKPRPKPSRTIIETSAEPPSRARVVATTLPEWIPDDAWQAFLEMRRSKKKPPTAYATEQLIAKLGVLMANGHDPRAVLDQSTVNSWTDLYPIKENANGKQRSSTVGAGGARDDIPTENKLMRAAIAGYGG